jgi:hypothetical protein
VNFVLRRGLKVADEKEATSKFWCFIKFRDCVSLKRFCVKYTLGFKSFWLFPKTPNKAV